MTSNAGTIAKFDRMGIVAKFIPEKHTYQRIGFRFNPDPNATEGIPFAEDVSSPTYSEFWSDELQLFHNPNARIPLPPEWLGGVTQHFFKDGQQHSIMPEGGGQVLAPMTLILQTVDR